MPSAQTSCSPRGPRAQGANAVPTARASCPARSQSRERSDRLGGGATAEPLRWLSRGSHTLKGLEEVLEIREAGIEGVAPFAAPAVRPSLVDLPCSSPYSASVQATVTSKGRITIPLAIRRRLEPRKGAVLEFDERADHRKAARAVDVERMRSVVGIAKRELASRMDRPSGRSAGGR